MILIIVCRNSVDKLSPIILKLSTLQNLIRFFGGESILQNKHWEYNLSIKIIFLSHYSQGFERLLQNLIYYLSNLPEGNDIIYKALDKLLNIWASKNTLKYTSFEQHVYLTTAIIFGIKSLIEIRKPNPEIKQKYFTTIMHGVTTHLESTSINLRATGMITGQILSEFLSISPKPLEFESLYQNMSKDTQNIINKLKKLDQIRPPEYEISDEYRLFVSLVLGEPITKRPTVTKTLKLPVSNEVKNSTLQSEIVHSKIELELDSDDDLEPYDMSNDVKLLSIATPSYLRDLIEAITETDNADLFKQSIECAENLILQQLPDDDASIGLELLTIFISTDERFPVESFENHIFNASIAIVTTYPIICAPYLSNEFHTGEGKYTISQRVLMLHILSASAKQLSSPAKQIQPSIIQNFDQIISKNCRRITSKRNPTITTKNKLTESAGYFFLPLIRGTKDTILRKFFDPKSDSLLLLCEWLKALSVILIASKNIYSVPNMAREVFPLVEILKLHPDARVKTNLILLLAAVVLTVPVQNLKDEFLDYMYGIYSWACDISSLRADPDHELREIAKSLIGLINYTGVLIIINEESLELLNSA